MRRIFKNIIESFRKSLTKFFVGNRLCELEKRIMECESTSNFMSKIVVEQTKLLASVAIIQNDMAHSAISDDREDIESEAIYIKLPLADDEFMN